MNSETKQNTTGKRSALGKGLASLLPQGYDNEKPQSILGATPKLETKSTVVNESSGRVAGITMVDPNTIEANIYQPRRDFDEETLKELSESIKEKGIIQPLVVRRGEGSKLHLIAGERRLRAAKMAGLTQIPVVLRQSSDKEALELALIENIQRENLNCVDIALSYFQLIEDFQLTQDEVSKRVGKNRSSVANHIRLLKLPEEIITDLREDKLSFGHGKALLTISDAMKRMEVRNTILEKGLSVRETEKLVTQILTGQKLAEAKKEISKESEEKESMRHMEQKLSRSYGSKVKFKGNAHKGSIVFKYHSRDDLDRLLEQLMN